MLYLILGNNKEKIERKIDEIGGDLLKLKIDAFNFDPDLLRGEMESVSLFAAITLQEEKNIVLNNISEDEEKFEVLKALTPVMLSSNKNVFIVENDLLKEEKDFFEKLEVEVLDIKEKKEFDWGFSPFALQDAVGAKDPKASWIEYQKIIREGTEPEEVIHKIVGKVRDMALISKGATKEDLGIKSDFPYNKSKKDLKNWQNKDLQNFYTKLVSIYHESRMGGDELELAIEKLLLTI